MKKEYWDKRYKKISDNTLTNKDIFSLLDEINLEYLLPYLPKGSTTIEVGCGAARLSCFLASHNYNTTCLDYSKDALKLAKNNYALTNNKGSFVLEDIRNISFGDDTFDAVLSTGLLEHFADPETVVSEMIRILKPGGVFYSDIVPKKFSLLRSLDFLRDNQEEKNDFYEKKMSKQYIINMLRDAKLENVFVFPAGVFPPPIPILERNAFVKESIIKILYRLKPVFKHIDNTILAEIFGFYYFTCAKKPKDDK